MSTTQLNDAIAAAVKAALAGTPTPSPSAEPPAKAKANGKAKATPKTTTDPVLAWICKAIEYYRAADGHKSKGIHTVISGFNGAFRAKYGTDPVEVTKAYCSKGLLQSHPARRGAMLYKAGEMPARTWNKDHSGDVAAIDAL